MGMAWHGVALHGMGMGWDGIQVPALHTPRWPWLSGCPTPPRHPAQSFPWELVHSKEPGDVLPGVSPSLPWFSAVWRLLVMLWAGPRGSEVQAVTQARGSAGQVSPADGHSPRTPSAAPAPPALVFLPLLALGWRWVFWRTEVFFKDQGIV